MSEETKSGHYAVTTKTSATTTTMTSKAAKTTTSSSTHLKVFKRRTAHYPNSLRSFYPSALLRMRYVSNFHQTHLELDPKHPLGESNPIVDLRRYHECRIILDDLNSKYQHVVEELNLNEHIECDDELLQYLVSLSLSNVLLTLNIAKCSYMTIRGLQAIYPLVNLTSLDVSGNTFINDESLEAIGYQMLSLQSINISHCTQVTDIGMIKFANLRAPFLMSLAVSHNDNLSYLAANEIVMKCQHLLHLNISYCSKINFIGVIVHIRDHMLNYISRKLLTLNVSGCKDLHPQALKWIATSLFDLQEFYGDHLTHADCGFVKSILGGCPSLKKLHVNHCGKLSKDGLRGMAQRIEKLDVLAVSAVGGDGDVQAMRELFVNCTTKMKYVDVSKNAFVTNDVFPGPDAVTGLPSVPRGVLEHLDVSNTSLTTFGVACALQAYPQLTHINISGLRHVNDAAMQAIASCCSGIKHIFANGCHSLTDKSIQVVTTYCKHLLTLHVGYDARYGGHQMGTQYSDKAMEFILTSAKRLREVNISNQQGVTCGTKWFGKTFPKIRNYSIERLYFTGCKSLSTTHLMMIFRACLAINDVYLPDFMIHMATINSKKFWSQAFNHTLYTRRYEDLDLAQQIHRIRQSVEMTIDTRKVGVGGVPKAKSKAEEEEEAQRKVLHGFNILQRHPLYDHYLFRDQLVRRRLVELLAIRRIMTTFFSYKIWKKFRYQVQGRKIARFIIRRIMERKRQIAIIIFTHRHAIKTIQMFWIQKVLHLRRAVRTIKRNYQRWKTRKDELYLKDKVKYIILIQKRIRGMLVRLSDRYIIAQTYLRLPQFWKQIAHLSPYQRVERGLAKRVNRSDVENYQVRDLLNSTSSLVEHISNDLFADRKVPPKMEKIIPQPFDKEPYVSLSDGRKLTFYSSPDSIFSSDFIVKTKNQKNFELKSSALKFLEGKDMNMITTLRDRMTPQLTAKDLQTQLPVHIYSSTFWPLTKAPNQHNVDVDLYNKDINNFEMILNTREFRCCQMCSNETHGHTHRLRMIHCKTCARDYCFACGFYYHRNLQQQRHALEFIEPRVIQTHPVSKSLIYHIDFAQNVMHDLKYVVRYLRSAAEVQRIAKEKQMLIEYERQQEQLRLNFLQAQALYQEKNHNATIISLLYRKFKARRVVREKRKQLQLEAVLQVNQKVSEGLVRFQVLYRRYRCRIWMYKKGFSFQTVVKYHRKDKDGKLVPIKSKKKKKSNAGKKFPKEEMLQFVTHDVMRRAQYQRGLLLFRLEDKYRETLSLIHANIDYWKEKYDYFHPQVTKLLEWRDRYFEIHKKRQQEVTLANLSNTQSEKEKNDKEVKVLFLRYENVNERLENVRNVQWWIHQHLRLLYRKKSLLPIRLEDIHKQLVYVSIEFEALQRILQHANLRVTKLDDKEEEKKDLMKAPREWIVTHVQHVEKQLIALDAQQETVLKEEIIRIEQEYYDIISFDALLEELIESLLVNNQLYSERIALDKQLVYLLYGSNEAIALNEQLLVLKSKQKQLTNNTIDNLKVVLQQKHDDHDKLNMLTYAFPKDAPDMSIADMDKIQAVMLTPYSSPSHIHVEDFLKVYSLQPWLAIESIEDIRFEERINAKEIQLGKLREEMKGLELRIKENAEQKRVYEEKVKECKQKIEVYTDPISDETDFQREKRETELEAANTDLIVAVAELEMIAKSNEEVVVLYPPLQALSDQLTREIDEVQTLLKSRIKLRGKASKLFFDVEKSLCEEMLKLMDTIKHRLEDDLLLTQGKVTQCQSTKDAYHPQKITSTEQRNATDIHLPECLPNFAFQLALQSAWHAFKPRVNIHTSSQAHIYAAIRQQTFLTQQQYIQEVLKVLTREEDFLTRYQTQRALYENFLMYFMQELQYQRRQRAMELDVSLRIARLQDVREIRLKALADIKRQQLEQIALEKKLREEAERNKVPFARRMAQNTKKAIRGVKDAVRDFKYRQQVAMDEEEQRMAKRLRDKSKEGLGSRPEGIRAIQFTIGTKQTERHSFQNEHLRNKGLPHFFKLDRSIGNQTYIWLQVTFDHTRFITDLVMAHKDPEHPQYKDYSKQRHWEYIDVDENSDHTTNTGIPLRFWFRRHQRKSKGIKHISVCFTTEEEARLQIDGYTKIEPNLSEFGLPESTLWIHEVEKEKKSGPVSTNAIIAEVNNVRDMVARQPGDRNLVALLHRMNEKLAEAYKREVENECTNPLAAAIDFMAMDEEDVNLWIKCFEKIDKERNGKLSLDQIFEYLDVVPSVTAKEVFYSMDAVDQVQFFAFHFVIISPLANCLLVLLLPTGWLCGIWRFCSCSWHVLLLWENRNQSIFVYLYRCRSKECHEIQRVCEFGQHRQSLRPHQVISTLSLPN